MINTFELMTIHILEVPFWPHLVSPWTLPLTFWPQNFINSSLSLVHRICKFGERHHSALLMWFASGLNGKHFDVISY